MPAHPPQPAPTGAAITSAMVVALAALALAAWLAGHPFFGIVHDNRLYALQALRYNDPATFGGDLFFRYGSQDSFTVFSPLYAGLIRLFGLDLATRLLVMAGQALWIVSAVALIRALVPRPFTWLAMLLLATAPTSYGGGAVFALGEGFVTPRLFSEALSIAALACFLHGRGWSAAVLLAAAALLHPLMAAAPAGIVLLLRLLRGRAWWWPLPVIAAGTLLLAAALLVAQAAGLPPARIDAEWKFIATTRSPQLLVGSWSGADWMSYAAGLILVLLASLTAKPPARQLFVTAASASLACIFLSFVAFDLLDTLLIGQLQIWRAAWVIRALAPIALALIAADACVAAHGQRRLLLALCISAGLFGALTSAAGASSLELPMAMLIGLVVMLDRSRTGDDTAQRLVGTAAWLALVCLWVLSLSQIFGHVVSPALSPQPHAEPASLRRLAAMFLPAVLLLAGFLVFFAGRRISPLAVVPLALLAVPAAAANWDQRDDWQRFMDSGPDISATLATPIAPHDSVYWAGSIMGAWVPIGRESFYSPAQGSGLIFSRQTALGFRDRLRRVKAFEPGWPWQPALLGEVSSTGRSTAGLQDLLALCTGEIRPDVIILDRRIPGARQEAWMSPVAMPQIMPADPAIAGRREVTTFYISRCTDKAGDAAQR